MTSPSLGPPTFQKNRIKQFLCQEAMPRKKNEEEKTGLLLRSPASTT